MEYRRLGRTGIKVSVLSFGSWVTFDTQVAVDAAVECMQAAHDAGCNFFDNAEAYAGGRSETIMGEALRQLDWPRWSYVVTTKLFWGIHDDVNMKNTLNRKYLLQAIDGSLERFGLDFVDIVYCHRPDPETTIEETVWAMSDIVSSGKALYWGTSEWSAAEIREAIEVAERHHLHKPVTEQPQYNLLERQRVEVEYAELFDEFGYGTTTWSPLASGLLTGKYRDGIPDDSRGALPGYGWLAEEITDPAAVARVEKLRPIADELGCTLAQLALAWCTKNPNVSTVITGASKVESGRRELRRPRRDRGADPRRPRTHRRRGPVAGVDSLHVVRTSDDKLPIQMLNDRLLVRIPDSESERRSQGGILIPATAQMAKRLVWAEVVAHGQNVRSAEVGDLVLFSPEDRYEVEVQGCDYIMLRERDIHAVAAQRIEASTGLYL